MGGSSGCPEEERAPPRFSLSAQSPRIAQIRPEAVARLRQGRQARRSRRSDPSQHTEMSHPSGWIARLDAGDPHSPAHILHES